MLFVAGGTGAPRPLGGSEGLGLDQLLVFLMKEISRAKSILRRSGKGGDSPGGRTSGLEEAALRYEEEGASFKVPPRPRWV